MVGERLSHYRIEARLGRGGMGEVLLARDLALGRTVAIQVLPEQFDPELRRRLLIEASASWLWGCDATTTAADLEQAARVLEPHR